MFRYGWLVLCLIMAVGCGRKHPVEVFIHPDMEKGTIEKIAVFPFASTLHHADDPDEKAPATMDDLFRRELDSRRGYQFTSPQSVTYALESAGLIAEADAFVEKWSKTREVDKATLAKLNDVLRVDGILIGVVDLWQKDEVDYRESAAPATYVGATVTILDPEDGGVLFKASDEDFLEGARSEERTVQKSALGAVRRDDGARVFKAPEHDEVAIRVVRALVSSLPAR